MSDKKNLSNKDSNNKNDNKLNNLVSQNSKEILLIGDEAHCDFYKSLLEKNNYKAFFLNEDSKKMKFKYAILFAQNDVLATEHIIKEVKELFPGINILPVVGRISFILLDTFYNLDLIKICYEFKPEQVLSELDDFIQRVEHYEKNEEKRYIINFYENKGIFFIDISGTMKKENLTSLKLMFKTYLQNKLAKLKAVVYIFNNVDENSSNFQTTWSLFRFWEQIGFKFDKVYYLSLSQRIINTVHKYVEPLGVKYRQNLFQVVKEIFPQLQKYPDEKLFTLVEQLLTNPLLANSK